jgi:hypothetical protein
MSAVWLAFVPAAIALFVAGIKWPRTTMKHMSEVHYIGDANDPIAPVFMNSWGNYTGVGR